MPDGFRLRLVVQDLSKVGAKVAPHVEDAADSSTTERYNFEGGP